MTFNIDITSDLDALIARMEAAPLKYQNQAAPVLSALMAYIVRLERSIMHEKTGRMIRSTYPEGPFSVGEGTLEGTVGPHVDYAHFEIERGGTHDFLAQTVEQMEPLLKAAQEQLERVLIEVVS